MEVYEEELKPFRDLGRDLRRSTLVGSKTDM
jgi:hypothetical protein